MMHSPLFLIKYLFLIKVMVLYSTRYIMMCLVVHSACIRRYVYAEVD